MNKSMLAVTVTTEDGLVVIKQDDIGAGEPIIVINPSQVPVLVRWLQEAAAELEQKIRQIQPAPGMPSRFRRC
jgi:hypothetical protein